MPLEWWIGHRKENEEYAGNDEYFYQYDTAQSLLGINMRDAEDSKTNQNRLGVVLNQAKQLCSIFNLFTTLLCSVVKIM